MNIEDIPDYETVVFTPAEYVSASILTGLGIIAVALDILILLAISRERTKTPGTRLIASLIVGDLLFSSVDSIYGFIDLSEGGWSTGKIGCLWDSILILTGVCASILSLIVLSLERILVVKYHYYLSKKECSLIIVSIWIVSIITCSYPLYTNTYQYVFGLIPAKFTCAINWWDKHPLSLFAISVVIIVVTSGIILVTSVYSYLYLYYRKLNRNRIQAALTTNMRSTIESEIAQSGNAEEQKLFIKCVTITSLFFGSWLPYLCKIFIELALSNPVASAYDSAASFSLALYSVLNAVCLIILDNRIKGGVREIMAPFFQWNSSLMQMWVKRSNAKPFPNESRIYLKTESLTATTIPPTVPLFKIDQSIATVKIQS